MFRLHRAIMPSKKTHYELRRSHAEPHSLGRGAVPGQYPPMTCSPKSAHSGVRFRTQAGAADVAEQAYGSEDDRGNTKCANAWTAPYTYSTSLENGYCFIFSKNVSGLTNRTTCPGCGVAVTLPHMFPEAYPWSRNSFVLKFLRSSQERFPSAPHNT